MTCINIKDHKKYNCRYLDNKNIKEFIKWVEQYMYVSGYNIYDNYLGICSEYEEIAFKYNNWYVYKNNGLCCLYKYSVEEFKNEYYFPDVTCIISF